jgi:hypothetical protein
VEIITKSKKGSQWELCSFTFETNIETINIKVDKAAGEWLLVLLQQIHIYNNTLLSLQQVQQSYEQAELQNFELFWDNKPVNTLYKVGLLAV